MDLLNFVSRAYGSKIGSDVEKYFTNLQLPIPQSDEYVESHNSSAHVFINPYACQIRLTNLTFPERSSNVFATPEQVEFTKHHHQLQPITTQIFQSNHSKLRADLYPGAISKQTLSQNWFIRSYYKDVIMRLNKAGIYTNDPNQSNFGTLPIKTPEFPDGYKVILDPGGVQKLSNSAKEVSVSLNRYERIAASILKLYFSKTCQFPSLKSGENPQQALYGDLYKAFEKAWPNGASEVDKTKMTAFWQTTKNLKKDGILISGWNMSGISQQASNYEQHCLDYGII